MGSRHDPKLYVLKFCELVCTTKDLPMCLKSCISTVLCYESTKIYIYIYNELYLCEKYNMKCDVDAKLALWANEPNALHEVRDMIFVMGELVSTLIIVVILCIASKNMKLDVKNMKLDVIYECISLFLRRKM